MTHKKHMERELSDTAQLNWSPLESGGSVKKLNYQLCVSAVALVEVWSAEVGRAAGRGIVIDGYITEGHQIQVTLIVSCVLGVH